MQTAWQSIANGQAGVAQILAQLTAAKDFYGALPCIRAAALVIAQPAENNDNAANCAALEAFVKSAICYVLDPVNAELVQTPDVLLLQIDSTGQATGDCDDHVLLFASLAESLGISCEITGVKTPGSTTYDHVIATAWIDGEPRQVDLCAKFTAAPVYNDVLKGDGFQEFDFITI